MRKKGLRRGENVRNPISVKFSLSSEVEVITALAEELAMSSGPVELPPVDTYLDPWSIPESSPLQTFASIILTGAITVLLLRSLKRRSEQSTELKLRSHAVERLEAKPANKVVEGAAPVSTPASETTPVTEPPTALNALAGALVAGSIALVCYKFSTSVDDFFSVQRVSTNYTVRNITVAVRTLISGIGWLATFVFATNTAGLTLLAFQIALGLNSPPDAPASPSDVDQTDLIGLEKKPEEDVLTREK